MSTDHVNYSDIPDYNKPLTDDDLFDLQMYEHIKYPRYVPISIPMQVYYCETCHVEMKKGELEGEFVCTKCGTYIQGTSDIDYHHMSFLHAHVQAQAHNLKSVHLHQGKNQIKYCKVKNIFKY